MKRLLGLFILVALAFSSPASAQIFVVQNCGEIPQSQATLVPGAPGMFFEDTTGALCGVGKVAITGPDGPEGGVSVAINPYRADATIRSGSKDVGGSWQQIAPANPLRQRFFVQNYCSSATQGIGATESLFIAIRSTIPPASPLDGPNGTEIVTCGSYDTSSAIVSTSPVWLWAATVNHRFQALEW